MERANAGPDANSAGPAQEPSPSHERLRWLLVIWFFGVLALAGASVFKITGSDSGFWVCIAVAAVAIIPVQLHVLRRRRDRPGTSGHRLRAVLTSTGGRKPEPQVALLMGGICLAVSIFALVLVPSVHLPHAKKIAVAATFGGADVLVLILMAVAVRMIRARKAHPGERR